MAAVHRSIHLAAILLAPAGCFYTSSINERPRAEIEKVTLGPHYPDEEIRFTAQKSSDTEDGGNIECTWSAHTCLDDRCMDVEMLQEPEIITCTTEYDVVIPTRDHRPIKVALRVQDLDGAEFFDSETIDVGNRPPDLVLPQPDYPGDADHSAVSIPIEVSIQVSDPDGDDPVAISWQLIKPRGAGADVELSPVDDSDLIRTFTPDTAGVWTVEVTADDSFEDGRVTQFATIPIMEDAPPCIAQTTPSIDPDQRVILQRDDPPRVFTVLRVKDELDPYPRASDADYLGDPEFSWQLASPDTGGDLVPVAGAASPDLTIDPAAYAPGDLIDLRVEVADRVERTIPCDQADPTCSSSGDTCYQRVTWGVEIR